MNSYIVEHTPFTKITALMESDEVHKPHTLKVGVPDTDSATNNSVTFSTDPSQAYRKVQITLQLVRSTTRGGY